MLKAPYGEIVLSLYSYTSLYEFWYKNRRKESSHVLLSSMPTQPLHILVSPVVVWAGWAAAALKLCK